MLCRFPEALEDMLKDLTPNRLTDYLYELSDKFTTFYKDCKVGITPLHSYMTCARGCSPKLGRVLGDQYV